MKQLIEKLVLIILGLTPLIWFYHRGNVLVNGVDTNFPLNPLIWFLRRFYVWNPITNGGVDFSSSTAGIFFHLIQVVPYLLGFNLHWVQIISFVFWFSLLIFSAYFLARIILPKNFIAQLLFVILYVFNIYLFNTWENIKVANLSLMVALPLALGTLILLQSSKIGLKGTIPLSAITGVVLSGAGINPAYFISFFVALLIFFFAQIITTPKRFFIKRVYDFLTVLLIITFANAFWILPTSNYIFKSIPISGSIDRIGFNNWIDSLSENTGALNIMRVQGAWDWYAIDSRTSLPLYIPYALNYFYKLPFLVFSFLLTFLAIFSFLFKGKEKNYLYVAFGVMFVIGVFLGMGTHLPSGTIYRILAIHIPFFTLFRSPWYIFTPLVTLSIAGLVSLLFYNLFLKFNQSKYFSILTYFLTVVIIVGNLIYCYPLLTGKIFRPGRLDGFYINFPQYIFDAGKWISQEGTGRVIGYPDDEIEKFSWGYRGIELILGLLVDRQILFSPLNAPDAPISSLIKEFYQSLKLGKIDSANSLAAKLNIGLIFYKGDQESLSPNLPKEFLGYPSKSFGKWQFYKFPNAMENLAKVYSSNQLFLGYPYQMGSTIIAALKKEDILINPQDQIITKNQKIIQSSNKVISASNSQLEDFTEYKTSPSRLSNRLIARDLSKAVFKFEVPDDGLYQPIIERRNLEDFGISLSKELLVELNGRMISWTLDKVEGSYIYFKSINLSKGSYSASLKLDNKNLIIGGDFNQGFVFEKGGEDKEEGRYEIEDESGEKFLSVLNILKADISAVFKPTAFNPLDLYYVEAKYKQIYGNNANVLVTQSGRNTLYKAQVERMPNHPEWKVFSFYYDPVKTNSDMRVELSVPATFDPLGTKILYDDLKVVKVFSNNLFLIKKSDQNLLVSPDIKIEKSSPVNYSALVTEADRPHVIVFSENYSPDWEISLFDSQNQKVKINPNHFSANLYANAWYIEGAPKSYNLQIHYFPQRLFWVGLSISSLTIMLSLIVLFFKFKR